MADIFELLVAVDLRNELAEQELAELRWHLGIGPMPSQLTVVTAFPYVEFDESEDLTIVDEPYPLLAETGAAWLVGGALCSTLVRRDRKPRIGWSLACRQEIHPDSFEIVGELLSWLAAQTHDHCARSGDVIRIGHIRFYEDLTPSALMVSDGRVDWPN